MTPLLTQRLLLRNWEERDRDAFHRLNADDRVMHFFGFRRDRAEADAFMDRLRKENAADGIGFAAVEERATGRTVGICGLHATKAVPLYTEGTVEIGWRLLPESWGLGYASEASLAWLAYGFETRGFDRVVAFAVWSNEASVAVMRRLGMRHVEGGDFDHAATPADRPDLKRCVLYEIRRDDWRSKADDRA